MVSSSSGTDVAPLAVAVLMTVEASSLCPFGFRRSKWPSEGRLERKNVCQSWSNRRRLRSVFHRASLVTGALPVSRLATMTPATAAAASAPGRPCSLRATGTSARSAARDTTRGLARQTAGGKPAEEDGRSRGCRHEECAGRGRDAATAGAAQERRPVVARHRGAGRGGRERRPVTARQKRPDCALGHLEDAGRRERSETGDLVQRRPRDRPGSDISQVHASEELGRDVAERDRPAHEGNGEHRGTGEWVSMGEWPRQASAHLVARP